MSPGAPWGTFELGLWFTGDPVQRTLPDGGLPSAWDGGGGFRLAGFNLAFLLSPQAARRPEEAAEPRRAMVPSRRTWNLGATPSLRGLWRVGRAGEPEPGMARPAPASPAARPFPHTGPGRLRTGESAFLKCLFISFPSSRYQR